jgi:hypothetical protein
MEYLEYDSMIDISSFLKKNEEYFLYIQNTKDDGLIFIKKKITQIKKNPFEKYMRGEKNHIDHSKLNNSMDSFTELYSLNNSLNFKKKKMFNISKENTKSEWIIFERYTERYFFHLLENDIDFSRSILEQNDLIEMFDNCYFFPQNNKKYCKSVSDILRIDGKKNKIKKIVSEQILSAKNTECNCHEDNEYNIFEKYRTVKINQTEIERKIIGSGFEIYVSYIDGKLDGNNGPSVVYFNGSAKWHNHGKLNRTTQPAREFLDGNINWPLPK